MRPETEYCAGADIVLSQLDGLRKMAEQLTMKGHADSKIYVDTEIDAEQKHAKHVPRLTKILKRYKSLRCFIENSCNKIMLIHAKDKHKNQDYVFVI